MKLEKAQNGYFITEQNGKVYVYKTFEELLDHLMLVFEGKNKSFLGESYGKIKIFYNPDGEI